MFFAGCATSAQGVPARAISLHTFSFIRYIIITGLARFGPLTQHALSCLRRCGPHPARPTDPRSHSVTAKDPLNAIVADVCRRGQRQRLLVQRHHTATAVGAPPQPRGLTPHLGWYRPLPYVCRSTFLQMQLRHQLSTSPPPSFSSQHHPSSPRSAAWEESCSPELGK